jgi:type IV pilus assembly protein PilW
MLKRPPQRPGRRAAALGVSIVELLVGVTIGLFIVGGGLSVFARNLVGARQVLAETRLNQDLRSAVDLVSRDLRRAGYWGNAILGTQNIGATSATTANPYSAITSSSSELTYAFSTDASVDNNTLDAAEQFGMRLNAGAIQLRVSSGNWTDITDTKSLTITSFSITPTTTVLPLGQFCARTCAVGSPGCPTTTVRSVTIVVQGQSALNSSIERSLRSTVRLRNDQLAGTCPP